MIKKEIMAIIFFGTSFTLLLGAEEKFEELKVLDTCKLKQRELSFNEIVFKSELEIFDEIVSGENFEAAVTADTVDNVELERSGAISSLLLRTEKSTPDSGIEIELQGAQKFTVPCLEDSCSVKIAIKRKKTLQKELLRNGGGASRGSFYSYCFVCNVWFLYYDKEGRHKRRKAFCSGYCLRKSEY